MNAWRFLLKFDRGEMESEKEVERGGGRGREKTREGDINTKTDTHPWMCGDLDVQCCYVIQCGRCVRSYVI